jgi:hypothetical protein
MRVPGTGHEASNSFHRETVSFWHLGQSTSASDLRADWPSTPPRSTLIAKLSVSHGLNQVPAEPITTGEMGQLTSAMKNLAGHELIQRRQKGLATRGDCRLATHTELEAAWLFWAHARILPEGAKLLPRRISGRACLEAARRQPQACRPQRCRENRASLISSRAVNRQQAHSRR